MSAAPVAVPAAGSVTDRHGAPCPSAARKAYPLHAVCLGCDSRIRLQDGTADWTHLSGQVLCGPADAWTPSRGQGAVDAYCQPCDSRVRSSGSGRCPLCNADVLPLSQDGPPAFLDPEGEAAAFDSWSASPAAPGATNQEAAHDRLTPPKPAGGILERGVYRDVRPA